MKLCLMVIIIINEIYIKLNQCYFFIFINLDIELISFLSVIYNKFILTPSLRRTDYLNHAILKIIM